MAPVALSDLVVDPRNTTLDPTVFPPADANEEVKRLWNLHGLPHSTSFSNPDLTSIAALVRHNAATIPGKPAFIHPSGDDGSFKIIDWATFDSLTKAAAVRYGTEFHQMIATANKDSKQPTVALLGNGNTIDYLITQIALLMLNFRVLLLSNKNAPSAREHLLDVCDVAGLIADASNALDPTLAVGNGYSVTPLATLSELDCSTIDEEDEIRGFTTDDVWNLQACIIHSSGSTGLPKPIIHTNRSLCLIARMYRLFQDFVIENWYEAFPLFHIAGISIILSGLPNGLPTTLPPLNWPPAPSAILHAWKKLEKMGLPVDCLHCAPSVIEDLYQYISLTTQDFSPLVNLKVLQPGGAPLSPTLLGKLVRLGVNVKTTYGSTEIGPVMRTIPHTRDNPNCYHVRNSYPDSPCVQMESLGDGLFECVVYKGFELAAELWPNDDAPNPYRTNDLFTEDPPNSGFFVLQGRKDDILVHDNGEKTHAGALQMQLEESGAGLITKAAVFGSGKPCTAVVIETSAQEDGLSQDGVEERVWTRIAGCNESMAQHSRIDRSMILVLKYGETLPVTPKGNVRRKEAWKLYGDRIEAMYAAFLNGGEETVTSEPTHHNHQSDYSFIAESTAGVCGVRAEDIGDEINFYDLGLDSQKAVKLRSKLSRRFGSFPLMFIFEYPTLGKLHTYLTTAKSDAVPTSSRRTGYIRSTVARLNQTISSWEVESPSKEADISGGEVIYLTGASGALGTAMLEVFVEEPRITRIYCAIRGNDPTAKLTESLKRRGYPSEVYSSSKLRAVSYDMRSKTLGLSEQRYNEMRDEVTVVVHNAWKMDFNQRVEMFEDDCLQAKGVQIKEAPVQDDPDMALNTGYAQSKFIVEKISQHWAKAFSMPVSLFRVGQLCGHSSLGVWNNTEMWPIMISTGINYLHAMPDLPSTTVNWLPVDICARSVCSGLLSEAGPGTFYAVHNLVNPSRISWGSFLDMLAQASASQFKRISMKEWVDQLEKLADGGDDSVPGLKLLSFFQDMAGEDGEEVEFQTNSVEHSGPMTTELLSLYLERWRDEGFM
ncbi:male sterility protein [Saccharata proteae CBS 121410]|uniref:Male sterility protein n=1 Tax=Saccharata proteae CBS 121410 TaxID=1314787 RepID=A0A6A5YCG0_9PEZI|nr:male sterility protein [Saccharata proteae CBS 121410]